MNNQKHGECSLAELCFIVDLCLQDFPDIQALRREQEICLVNNLERLLFEWNFL